MHYEQLLPQCTSGGGGWMTSHLTQTHCTADITGGVCCCLKTHPCQYDAEAEAFVLNAYGMLGVVRVWPGVQLQKQFQAPLG